MHYEALVALRGIRDAFMTLPRIHSIRTHARYQGRYRGYQDRISSVRHAMNHLPLDCQDYQDIST